MDKNSFSHYGWIIVTTMIFAVLLAFASPFGEWTRMNINIMMNQWFDDEKIENPPELDTSYGVYTTVRGFKYAGYDVPEDWTCTNGDTFVFGDYKYTYKDEYAGWTVIVQDTQKESYENILAAINGQPVTSMYKCFYKCSKMKVAPKYPNTITTMEMAFLSCISLEVPPVIPPTVTNLDSAFFHCIKLTTTPVIPEGVTNMQQAFSGCTSITISQDIPSSVTNLSYAFQGCNNLVVPPYIPPRVEKMVQTFFGCTLLRGVIEMDNTPTEFDECFKGTEIYAINGSCNEDVKTELLATAVPIG